MGALTPKNENLFEDWNLDDLTYKWESRLYSSEIDLETPHQIWSLKIETIVIYLNVDMDFTKDDCDSSDFQTFSRRPRLKYCHLYIGLTIIFLQRFVAD